MSEAQKSQRKVLIRAKTNKKKLATIIEKEKLGEYKKREKLNKKVWLWRLKNQKWEKVN